MARGAGQLYLHSRPSKCRGVLVDGMVVCANWCKATIRQFASLMQAKWHGRRQVKCVCKDVDQGGQPAGDDGQRVGRETRKGSAGVEFGG